MTRQRIVVVGGGFAGASVVKALLARAEPDTLRIHLVESEVRGTYDRFDLIRVLRGETKAEEIVRYPPAWFQHHGVDYHAGTTVHIVDRFRRQVHAGGLVLPYDKLILATGSSPYLPSIRGLLSVDGSLRPGIFTFHTLKDSELLGGLMAGSRRVVVLGGGRLGIELTEGLARRGVEVHLFHIANRLMSSQLDDGAAAILKSKLDVSGAHVHFGKRATAVSGQDELRGLVFHDGSELECDALIMATGLQPQSWLAYQCGLTVERAIVVESRMRSIDDLDVHALGECAQWRGAIHGLPEQIVDQAHVIAAHLTQQHSDRRYVGFSQGALYQVMGVNVSALGNPEIQATDDVLQLAEPSRGRYKKLVLRSGRVVGAILLGDVRQAKNLGRLYASNARLTREAQHRLFDLPPLGEGSIADSTAYASKH
jgi:nitrite reductase (NADH) large subunit